MSKLHLGGISFSPDEAAIRKTFEAFGQIDEISFIKDRETNRGRGFAFVTFEKKEDADKAKEALDGTTLDGRSITVEHVIERGYGEHAQRGYGGHAQRGYLQRGGYGH